MSTCFHVALIIFVTASVRHKNARAIDSVVCESFIEEMNSDWKLWCWVEYTP